MMRPALIVIFVSIMCALPTWDAPLRAQDSDALTAETWYKVGMGYLKNEKFLSAGDAFHEAYKLAKDPALLYNAARSYEKAGQLERAKKLYLSFTIQDGVEKSRKEKAIERIEAIDTQLLSANKAPNGTETVSRLSAPSTREAVPWNWITIGSGLVLAIGMGVMVELAQSERETLNSKLRIDESGLTSGVSQFDAYDMRDRANALETAALVSGIASVAMLVTGVALWVFEEDAANVSVVPIKRGMLLSAGGQF